MYAVIGVVAVVILIGLVSIGVYKLNQLDQMEQLESKTSNDWYKPDSTRPAWLENLEDNPEVLFQNGSNTRAHASLLPASNTIEGPRPQRIPGRPPGTSPPRAQGIPTTPKLPEIQQPKANTTANQTETEILSRGFPWVQKLELKARRLSELPTSLPKRSAPVVSSLTPPPPSTSVRKRATPSPVPKSTPRSPQSSPAGPTFKQVLAPDPEPASRLVTNVWSPPARPRDELAIQREITANTAVRLAKEARTLFANLKRPLRDAWYSDLDIETIQRIADGYVDPLAAKHSDHAIRLIPQKFQGAALDFMNLGLSLHHFSARSNHSSIYVHGLVSRNRARVLGLKPEYVSSDWSRQRDTQMGLDDYVHLSFTNRAAMAYSVEQRNTTPLADYRISPGVLTHQGTMFCRGYANALDAAWIPFEHITALDLIALYIGFDRMNYWQLMVEGHIPDNLLKRDDSKARSRGAAAWQ